MNHIDDIGYWLLSIAVLLAVAIARPTQARCARGFWLSEGVRASGEYACARLPAEPIGDRDLKPENAVVRSRVYCTSGQRPVVVGGVEVSCQAGGWK